MGMKKNIPVPGGDKKQIQITSVLKMRKQPPYPEIKSPDGEIHTCIFFATKTPPGIEWFGLRVENRDKDDIVYYGVVDSRRWEFAYFSLNDIIRIEAEYTTDPEIIGRISLPRGWEMFNPARY